MALNPATIPAILLDRVASHGGEVVLRKKDHGIWKSTTWSELGSRVREIGFALKAVGFRPGDVACVVAETRPEWVHIDLAILGAGGISAGIHPGEEPEQLGQALRESRCRVLFVENEEQLDKALTIRERCPALERIVIIDMKGLRDFIDPRCESLQSFLARGVGESGWEQGVASITAEQPAILLLQGGKNRTLTHGDALHFIANARSVLPLRAGDERLALLPMCHVMERVLGLYLALEARMISNYLENPDTITENLQEVQPTIQGTDPRLWQMLHARVANAVTGATPVQRALYRWAIAAGARGGVEAVLARLLVLRAVRKDLGLLRLRAAYLGSVGLPPDVERWVEALGVNVLRIDGKAARGAPLDARYQALMQEAYGT